jgi:hypothetical protein
MLSDAWLDLLLDIAFSPALWLSAALGTVYSLLFYAWRGGQWRQLGRDLLAGLAGFALGQLAGPFLPLGRLAVGQVYVLWGTTAAVATLILSRWLWQKLASG